MLGELRDQMRYTIHVGVFAPGQMFVFGAMCYIANSPGHIGLVKTFVVGRVVHFGNQEFIADSRGELILQGLASSHGQEQPTTFRVQRQPTGWSVQS